MKKLLLPLLLLFGFLSFPYPASGHEVYVLSKEQINIFTNISTLNPFTALAVPTNVLWFLFFMFAAITSLSISFIVGYSRWGVRTAQKIETLSWLALPIIRIVLGISLLYSAYYNSLFGPELPLSHLLGGNLWSTIMYLSGILVILGLFTRMVGAILFVLFVTSAIAFQEYMITYVNYLGEILVLLLFGGDRLSLDKVFFKKFTLLHVKISESLAIPILRISFAISLLYAALYAKFLHTPLTYQVALQYQMDRFFPFDPLFVVLGAGIVEIVIGLLFLFGVNMRWNILFFAFWATLSLVFFGEAVWPHYILFGISIGLFLYGYDKFTLEKWLVKRAKKVLT